MNNKSVIIIGGGTSIKEGISLGLWENIKDKEIWSLNYAYKTMPYLPKRELWIDISFFTNNTKDLQELNSKGVELHCKEHGKYSLIPEIKKYTTTRLPIEANNKIFVGRMGLSGFFGLSLAIKEKYDTIYLLGYDFGLIEGETKTHYYQNDIQVISSGVGRPELYRAENNINLIKPEIVDFELYLKESSKIYNVSLKSNINYFEKIDYITFFQKIKNEV